MNRRCICCPAVTHVVGALLALSLGACSGSGHQGAATEGTVAGQSARRARHDPGARGSAATATSATPATSSTPPAAPAAPAPPAPPAPAAPAAPLACAGRPTTRAACAPRDGCVWDRSYVCRDAANACERVAHSTRDYRPDTWVPSPHGRPTFLGGDPCAAVDPRCGYDVRTNLCQPFVALDRCPASAKDARAQQVFCMHPSQPALNCRYKAATKNKINGGVTFSCRRPPRGLTGHMPPPGSFDTPVGWLEQMDYDDYGCPLSTTAFRARCSAPQKQQCRSGLTIFQCLRGRWRGTRTLSPPPRAR